MKRILLPTLFVLFGTSIAFAQIKATGVATDDATGEPLPFVTVLVKGTKTSTATLDNGSFSITVPSSESVLQFSFLGYETLELPATQNMSVRMKPLATTLEDVVITGYQTIAREKVTGSVTSINATALQERHSPNVMTNMEGRVAGLVKTRDANGNDQFTIRGVGTLNADRNPLYVVDGLPIEGSYLDLNAYDIENVTILKDAAAAAMYGARASNGIIVVTTKNPKEMGRVSIDVSANFTLYQKRNVDYADNFLLTPEQQVQMEAGYYYDRYVVKRLASEFDNQAYTNNNAFTPIQYAYYQLAKGEKSAAEVNTLLKKLGQNNYAKEYAEKAMLHKFVQQYNVAIRSMTEKLQHSLVVNEKHDNLGLINHSYNQFQIFYKGEYKAAKWLTMNFSMNNVLHNETSTNNDGFLNESNNVWTEMPYSRLLNEDGSFANNTRHYSSLYEQNPDFLPMHYNALQELAYDKYEHDRQTARYHAGLTFHIIEGLNAQAQFIYETDRTTNTRYSEPESYKMRVMVNEYTVKDNEGRLVYMVPKGGRKHTENNKGDYWTARGQLNYTRTFFDKHAVEFLAGMELRETLYKGTNSLLLGYDEQLQVGSLAGLELETLRNMGTNPYFYGKSVSTFGFISSVLGMPRKEAWHRFASGYTNLTYTYDGKYSAFASFRKDYADLYGLDNKYRGKPLWSVGLSWILSRETFMKDFQWIDYVKVRGSYGLTGNIKSGLTSILTGRTISDRNAENQQNQAMIDRPANPYMTWEKTATTNVGIDFSLFGSRLRGTLDGYYKKADDVFSTKLMESTTGYTTMEMNVASLYNQGVEWTLSYDWFQARERDQFSWTTSLSGAYNKNEITYYEKEMTRASHLAGDQFRMGYAVSGMWSYRFAGLDASGQRRTYYDLNGTPVYAGNIEGADLGVLVYSGQKDPKVTMGMEHMFRYKGLSLNIMAVYYGGHQLRWGQPAIHVSPVGANNPGTMPSYLLRAWTPTNTNTDVPASFQYAAESGNDMEGAYQNADIYVRPADFLKIRNLVLGYDLPKNIIAKVGMQSATIHFQIDNLPEVWVKNDVGIDPETGGLRQPTSFILGINCSF